MGKKRIYGKYILEANVELNLIKFLVHDSCLKIEISSLNAIFLLSYLYV